METTCLNWIYLEKNCGKSHSASGCVCVPQTIQNASFRKSTAISINCFFFLSVIVVHVFMSSFLLLLLLWKTTRKSLHIHICAHRLAEQCSVLEKTIHTTYIHAHILTIKKKVEYTTIQSMFINLLLENFVIISRSTMDPVAVSPPSNHVQIRWKHPPRK